MTHMMETAMQNKITNVSPENVDNLLEKEWLLANSRGSYSSSTVIGCNTRRYHGLLVASLLPPVERIVSLSNVLETVTINGENHELANFEFSDRLHPQGYTMLKNFRKTDGVHFLYEIEGVSVEKSIYLAHDQDTLIIQYAFSGDMDNVSFSVMPMVALRDFHSLQSSSTSLEVEENDQIVTARMLDPHGPAVHMYCPGAEFGEQLNWWYSMRYRQEAARGQQDYEDVWAPGVFQKDINGNETVTLMVSATRGVQRPGLKECNPQQVIEALRTRREQLEAKAQVKDETEKALTRAADQLIVRRMVSETQESTSILAGFHWFADWGRDTFISLPGLLLCTGRYEEAREVLDTFGSVLDMGQIPNRFDDYGGEPHYNSVDASLWFINAAYQYLQTTDDKKLFDEKFRPMIAEIITAYSQGTRDNIHAQDDGLIFAGDADTQLTWMDAKCNGISFTPRYGKAVEINALWYNALEIMANTASDDAEKKKYAAMARKVKKSFQQLFWNEQDNCLYDCVYPDGSKDGAVRPNQVFAVSLAFSALTQKQQKGIVKIVQEQLLTPYGLRSLSPLDSRYQGHYHGDQFQRDSAYHQGTVWSFLIGGFIEAFLKVNKSSAKSRKQAMDFITPLLQHLNCDACIGNVSEIFDGDFPHRPKACIAQAWGVAELLRSYKMIKD